MSYTEEDTIESFLINHICEAIDKYNGEVDQLCDDDDLVLIEDGITDNSIEKIKTICSRVDRKRAPLKMIVLWITVYLWNQEDIDMHNKVNEIASSFKSIIIEDENWYEYNQQENLGIKPLFWSNYLGNNSDRKYVIADFRKGIDEAANIFHAQDNINVEICIWIIWLLDDISNDRKVFLCTNIETSDLSKVKTRVLAGIKLSILLSGKILHGIQEYTYEPLELTNQRGIFDCRVNYDILSKSYEQYEQIYEVINEYNGTRGIIEKYLKLYQVLEELMVRVNVVKFSKETISVRSLEEFKSIKSSEREALKRLFVQIFYENALSSSKIPDKELLDEIKELWCTSDSTYCTNLNERYSEIKEMKQTSAFDFIALFTEYKVEKIAEFYSYWIYELRCEIVHNKATEYHMTYINIDDKLKKFMISFFLPSMEVIVFHTLIRVPECLQYDRQAIEIKLW